MQSKTLGCSLNVKGGPVAEVLEKVFEFVVRQVCDFEEAQGFEHLLLGRMDLSAGQVPVEVAPFVGELGFQSLLHWMVLRSRCRLKGLLEGCLLLRLRDHGSPLPTLREADTRVEALVARAGLAASVVRAALRPDDGLACIRSVFLSNALSADGSPAPLPALQYVHK